MVVGEVDTHTVLEHSRLESALKLTRALGGEVWVPDELGRNAAPPGAGRHR